MLEPPDKLKNLIPQGDKLAWPVVQAMRAGTSLHYHQIAKVSGQNLGIPTEAIELPRKTHKTVLSYRVAWVLSILKAAKLTINCSRGHWKLTDLGMRATEEQVQELYDQSKLNMIDKGRKALDTKQEPFLSKSRKASGKDRNQSSVLAARLQRKDQQETDLLDRVAHLDPGSFERLMRKFLEIPEETVCVRNLNGERGWIGFEKSFRVMPSMENKTSIWCCSNIRQTSADEMLAILDSLEVGVNDLFIIAVGGFSQEASNISSQHHPLKVSLFDGLDFARLMIESGMGIKTVEATVIDLEFFKNL